MCRYADFKCADCLNLDFSLIVCFSMEFKMTMPFFGLRIIICTFEIRTSAHLFNFFIFNTQFNNGHFTVSIFKGKGYTVQSGIGG
jgi:hypothetical protein